MVENQEKEDSLDFLRKEAARYQNPKHTARLLAVVEEIEQYEANSQ